MDEVDHFFRGQPAQEAVTFTPHRVFNGHQHELFAL